ncbi:bifunctional protein GlmU-like [Penaeus japonicus]|uniref:bifunctional protein GlmU-like n=1 Tax=Penaeus japonicus TaxID=27405 RepID=UPI001C7122CE|nr:bifunctional protein GlmU-like [Penaeus japonicus]
MASPPQEGKSSSMKVHMLRLTPGQEVKSSLEEYVAREAKNGVFVMTCCGSLTSATLRLAANEEGVTSKVKTFHQHFEVLGMSGTIGRGGTHLHISLSDNDGRSFGGHVMKDLFVFTTMEIALGEPTDLVLGRAMDDATGYDELTVTTKA